MSLCEAFVFISTSIRFFEFSNTYSAVSYGTYFYIAVVTTSYFYGRIIEIKISLERASNYYIKLKKLFRFSPAFDCFIALLVCILINCPYFFVFQPSSVTIELKNGKTVGGQLIQKSETEVSIATTDLGQVTIPWSTIKSMNMVAKEETVRLANPQPSRYFFAPSAIPLKKGDKYYQNALFLLNSFQAGITDHFSLGAGILVPFAIYITPKIGYQVADKVHVGGGSCWHERTK
jgi:hypothetical protein